MRPDPEPSEWKTDTNGKRYRDVNYGSLTIREYEMEYSNGLTQSQLHALNAQKAAARKEQQPATPPKPARRCPFNYSGMPSDCKDNCALYDGEACALGHIADKAARDTTGRKCPFNPYQCDSRCSLYKSGCVLTNVNPRKRGNKNG